MKTPRPLSQALLGAFVLFTLGAQGFSAAPPVESPVGSFGFDAPDDPPSGPPQITPMVFLNGPYSEPFYLPAGSNTFLTMDASGKVLADSSIPGFSDKKEGSSVRRTLFVRTVNGLPVLTANAAAGGMFDDGAEDSPTGGSGKASIPFRAASEPQNGVQQVTVMSSFSGKRDRNTEKEPTDMNTLELDVDQLEGVVFKDWGMNLTITERTNSRTNRKFYVADLYFYNPNGTRTYFAEKTVVYSPTNGYSISFSKGLLFDDNDAPILDTKGKQVVDKYSSINFSNLLFKKFFDTGGNPFWEPAAGGVNYKFLGQKGFGHVFNFDISNFTFGAASSPRR